jgi:hypothetical protein
MPRRSSSPRRDQALLLRCRCSRSTPLRRMVERRHNQLPIMGVMGTERLRLAARVSVNDHDEAADDA